MRSGIMFSHDLSQQTIYLSNSVLKIITDIKFSVHDTFLE